MYVQFIATILSFFSEQCHNLISGTFKTSCKTGQGVEEMFNEIAQHLVQANRSRMELQTVDTESFKISQTEDLNEDPPCLC